MLSPYSFSRPGGVQGQVIGLSRALRALGHHVTVLAPAEEGETLPAAVGDHFVIGRPTRVRSNGSVAPVAFWPSSSVRAERFVRHGGFDVVHFQEPLAPMAAYGFALTAPLPMVGTYHRAGTGCRGTPWPPSRGHGPAATDPRSHGPGRGPGPINGRQRPGPHRSASWDGRAQGIH